MCMPQKIVGKSEAEKRRDVKIDPTDNFNEVKLSITPPKPSKSGYSIIVDKQELVRKLALV
jgi:hypothetical protein